MKNFYRLHDSVNVMPLMLALQQQPSLWNQNTLRTAFASSPHAQASDIWLRFNDITKVLETGDARPLMDERESIYYPAFYCLPQAKPLIFGLMELVGGERLGRCMIAKLPPGGRIEPHVDGGAHAAYYERFHVVLKASAGVSFRAGDEVVQMRTGEIWWFDNSQEHEVVNHSNDDRVHLIVDVRCQTAPSADAPAPMLTSAAEGVRFIGPSEGVSRQSDVTAA